MNFKNDEWSNQINARKLARKWGLRCTFNAGSTAKFFSLRPKAFLGPAAAAFGGACDEPCPSVGITNDDSAVGVDVFDVDDVGSLKVEREYLAVACIKNNVSVLPFSDL